MNEVVKNSKQLFIEFFMDLLLVC